MVAFGQFSWESWRDVAMVWSGSGHGVWLLLEVPERFFSQQMHSRVGKKRRRRTRLEDQIRVEEHAE
jgi:hypothetical protein